MNTNLTLKKTLQALNYIEDLNKHPKHKTDINLVISGNELGFINRNFHGKVNTYDTTKNIRADFPNIDVYP